MPNRRITALFRTLTIAFVAMLVVAGPSRVAAQTEASQQPAPSTSKVKTVGTIKSISGNTVTLATDSGSEITVLLQSSTRLLRMAPGQTDLKQATPIQAQDLQVGDRLLAAGSSADGGKSRQVRANLLLLRRRSFTTET